MLRRSLALCTLLVSLCMAASVSAQLHTALHAERFEAVEQLVSAAIARGELPGCVIEIGTRAGTRFARAFGERTRGEPMTIDTLFDLASLTKPLTAAALLLLVDEGKLELDQPAARYLPELATTDKRRITLRQLLLHTSGLPRVGPLSQVEHGREAARASIAAMRSIAAPGARFEYGDLGYLLLGEIVAQVAGMPLEAFMRQRLFEPLGMRDTHYRTSREELGRVAPTELRDEQVIRGVVDDPRAYRLGGVAGHAGVFSTASDVARFARMLLSGGELEARRVLTSATATKMLTPTRAGVASRALGWDVQSAYSQGRGSLLSRSAIGHGGYTGTSVWIDPERDLYVVVLSNRVHVGARGTLHPLASSIADVAVRALATDTATSARPRVGIDVLHAEAYARLRGRTVAVLTHAAARDQQGVSTLDRLIAAPSVQLRAILTPEHGLSGKLEGKVGDQRYRDLPVYSLYGKTRRPSAEMLRGVDTLVIDLVDVGTRFYTYMSSVAVLLEVASELGLSVLLLDRPNPLDGIHVEGPISEPAFASFVNYQPLPLRHGMTAGELARFVVSARGLQTRLAVVRIEGWNRAHWSGELASTWHPPSPNLGSKLQALLYPAIGLVEGTNLSVGRGTAEAFAVVGAPFVNGERLAQALSEQPLPGVEVRARRFRPTVGPYAGKSLPGVAFRVRDVSTYSASRTGLTLIRVLQTLYPAAWDRSRLALMVAHRETLALLDQNVPIVEIEKSWERELSAFARERSAALLY
jgi:uncharacterized protein YbbC (DUF1343 family)